MRFYIGAMLVFTTVPTLTQDKATTRQKQSANERRTRAIVAVSSQVMEILNDRSALEVEEMQQFLKLDAQTTRRLGLVAKQANTKVVTAFQGAIDARMRKGFKADWQTIQVNFRKFDLNSGEEVEQSTDAPDVSAVITVSERVQGIWCDFEGIGGSYLGSIPVELRPENSDKWKAIVSKVPVAARERLAKYRATRRRSAVVDGALATLSFHVSLRKDQHAAVRKWIDAKVPPLSLQHGTIANLTIVIRQVPIGPADVLTDAQKKTWKNLRLAGRPSQW